jgi:hypothetical protein
MFQLGQEKTGDHRNECSCIRNPMWGGSLLNWVELMQPAFFLGGDQQDLTGRTVGKESREPSKVKCPWMYHIYLLDDNHLFNSGLFCSFQRFA